MTILLVNPMNDFHANYFAYKLKKRDIPFIELGALKSNDYTYQDGRLIYNGKLIENITSIYTRGNLMYHPSKLDTPYIDTYNEQICFRSKTEMLLSWIEIEEQQGKRSINSFIDNSKHLQLHRFIQAGLQVPKTCITNSLEQASEFLQSVGNAVLKPLSGGYFCEKVSISMLDKFKSISGEPVIFQEYIDGDDIRVYILDGKIISAHKIEKDPTSLSIDYRTNQQFSKGEAKLTIIDLPENIKKACVTAASLSGLTFSGIDFKRTKNGEYYLLECNSMPQYLDVEFQNGVGITNEIIDYLYIEEKGKCNHTVEAILPLKNSSKDNSIFDYKELYKKHYINIKEREGTIILPIDKEQAKEFNEEIVTPDDPFLLVNIKDS